LGRLVRLYEAYGDRAEFLFVYVREAPHLTPAEQAVARQGPRSAAGGRRIRERIAACGVSFPCLLDTDTAAAEDAYDAWPQRLLLVGADGTITYDAGRGLPGGGDLDEFEARLCAAVAPPSQPAGPPLARCLPQPADLLRPLADAFRPGRWDRPGAGVGRLLPVPYDECRSGSCFGGPAGRPAEPVCLGSGAKKILSGAAAWRPAPRLGG
jgi:hypothetical protein